MITRQEYENAVSRSLQILDSAGIVTTPQERARIEVADFGLGGLQQTGLQILTYVNTDRCCAKELVIFPQQTCPDHGHPTINGVLGKEETFRCRSGTAIMLIRFRRALGISSLPPASRFRSGLHRPARNYSPAGRSIHAFA